MIIALRNAACSRKREKRRNVQLKDKRARWMDWEARDKKKQATQKEGKRC